MDKTALKIFPNDRKCHTVFCDGCNNCRTGGKMDKLKQHEILEKEKRMKAEKVIDILNRIVEEDWHVYTDDAIEALEIAKDTMTKEIPVKPYFTLFHITLDQNKYCPNCGTLLNDKEQGDYCPGCGQKILWEEKDEGV